MSNKKYKIALIGFSLGEGGGEKVMANLSVFFDKAGIDVHIVTVLDIISYAYSGTVFNMGLLKNDRNDFLNKFKRLIILKRYLKKHKFDYIIDFRPRNKYFQEVILSRFIYNTKTILTIHSYLIEYYMPKNRWFTRFIYAKNYATITIVPEIKRLVEKKYNIKKVKTIYNPINIADIHAKWNELIDLQYNYIIAVGQYNNNVKQFDKLIVTYANSILPHNNIHLVILGKGNQGFYEKIATDNNIQSFVHFLGFQNNPYPFLKKALFLVLSSKNEGSPNVLVEALACKTPVVAFNCPTGPSDIIENKKNGLLVEDQNMEQLTHAMNVMITDHELYHYCKENALQSIEKFSLEKIGQEWLDLMNINTNV